MTNSVSSRPVRRALISTSDKTGLLELAKQLVEHDIEIIATGGTAALLTDNNIAVTEVADYTKFPEIMNGRVKSLHPKIYGGLLGRRGHDDTTMAEHEILPIDLLVVNLYPFQATIADPQCTLAMAIEKIDVGGPSMLRAGAKNFSAVTVVVDPRDYSHVIGEIKTHHGSTTLATRRQLAYKTFKHLVDYDKAIADYLTPNEETSDTLFPTDFRPDYHKKQSLRYGENPHQAAAFYTNTPSQPGTLAQAKLLQGKALSFNNLMDSDCALNCVRSLSVETPGCVIVKHATPCGVAQGNTQSHAYEKALATDPSSAFGGIIAFNTPLQAATAEKILAKQFVEVILAPHIEPDALALLNKKTNLRVLATDQSPPLTDSFTLHSITGGLLIQQMDTTIIDPKNYQIVSKRTPTPEEMQNCLFAWRVVKSVKSNAIVYAKDEMTLGIGTGQTSRVFAAQIAALKAKEAGLTLQDAVMASDAFFPFADGIEVAATAGITAVIQPGGSQRDNEVIAAADKANIAMVLTGVRHFRH